MKRINLNHSHRPKATWGRTMAIIFVILVTFAVLVIIWMFQAMDNRFKLSWAVEYFGNVAVVHAATLTDENKALAGELEAIKAKYPNPTQQEIESYVKTIFGPDAKTAIAISHHECGPTNKAYPKCELKSSVEDSIGLFQINLYNSKQWVHAGRIPGTTMAEKVLWLQNPFNNTLYAFWVFKTSGFTPWSSYNNGAYLK